VGDDIIIVAMLVGVNATTTSTSQYEHKAAMRNAFLFRHGMAAELLVTLCTHICRIVTSIIEKIFVSPDLSSSHCTEVII